MTGYRKGLFALSFAVAGFAGAAHAEAVRIAAIGASNTAGFGVSQGWPVILEGLLRAKGYDASVSVHGGVGNTSGAILGRIDSSVAPGTKIVVYDVGKGNDADAGKSDTAANRAEIEQHIKAKGAKPIFVGYARIVGPETASSPAWTHDGHHHLTQQSHQRIASAILPQVVAAIGKR